MDGLWLTVQLMIGGGHCGGWSVVCDGFHGQWWMILLKVSGGEGVWWMVGGGEYSWWSVLDLSVECQC